MVFWLVGDDEAKVRDGTVLSYMMSLALLSALPLWNTLHKTQSSCNQQQIKELDLIITENNVNLKHTPKEALSSHQNYAAKTTIY